MSNEHDIKVLNGLIETTIDSVEGYQKAAEKAEGTRFTMLFARRAEERSLVVADLRQLVVSLGGKPEDDGTVLGAAHRFFAGIHASMSKGDKAIVDEVESGEDHIKAKYEHALEDAKVSTSVQGAISRAYVSVKSGHDEMSALKHSLHQ